MWVRCGDRAVVLLLLAPLQLAAVSLANDPKNRMLSGLQQRTTEGLAATLQPCSLAATPRSRTLHTPW